MINYDKMKSIDAMTSYLIKHGSPIKSCNEMAWRFKVRCWEGQFLCYDDLHLDLFASSFGYIRSQDRYILNHVLNDGAASYLEAVALGQETDTSLVEVAKQIIEDKK